MDAIEKRARELLAEGVRSAWPDDHGRRLVIDALLVDGLAFISARVAVKVLAAALTPPEGSDQSLLELAATFETCIPFLPSAGQRNIGKAVAHLRHMAMGYVLVPVEPTPAMIEASYGHYGPGAYEAMLAARPEVKP